MPRGSDLSPVSTSQRHIILDVLRGFALLGICMANFPEFSLYSFLSEKATEAMPTSWVDNITHYLLYIFVDGKFYTIFSLLFGIGFSIILNNISKRGGNGLAIFYRRMVILLLIGFLHLMLVWSGDILMLYAIVGMALPLFIRFSDKALLRFALFFLVLPVLIDFICEIFTLHPSAAIVGWQWKYCDEFGITPDNFAYWLRDSTTYTDTFKFLIQGAIVRLQEFVDGNRYFKVMGLFIIGYWIGRNKFYAEIEQRRRQLKRISIIGLVVGLPLSVAYAWSAMSSHRLGFGFHSILYFMSVYLTAFGYIATISLLYMKFKGLSVWKFLSAPGRMALTNYIGQSFIGMIIFYGIGFGLGASMGLTYVELIVLGVYLLEILFSRAWLRLFRFGPLEWVWRCLTYGRIIKIGIK